MKQLNHEQTRLLACALAERPTESTKHMDLQERTNGIEQMLLDLERLAYNDGCIAAAWALEFIAETKS